MIDWSEILKQAMGIMAIVDPVGSVGFFLSLTIAQTRAERSRTALLTSITLAVVLITAVVMGERLLWFFGIGVPSFQVGGGIIMLMVSIDMLSARKPRLKGTPEEAREAEERDTVAVVPLGIPLLAGPGAITTVIINSHSTSSAVGDAISIGIILAVALFTWFVFRMAVPIGSLVGQTGLNIVTRLMGLVLAAISVEIISNGLKGLFPALAGPL